MELNTSQSIIKPRGSGAEVISLKGGAGFAVGISIRDVVHSIALGQDRILPVSSLVNGAYGLRDVCISVPTIMAHRVCSITSRSSCGPRKCRLFSTRRRFCGKRSTRLPRAIPRQRAKSQARQDTRCLRLAYQIIARRG